MVSHPLHARGVTRAAPARHASGSRPILSSRCLGPHARAGPAKLSLSRRAAGKPGCEEVYRSAGLQGPSMYPECTVWRSRRSTSGQSRINMTVQSPGSIIFLPAPISHAAACNALCLPAVACLVMSLAGQTSSRGKGQSGRLKCAINCAQDAHSFRYTSPSTAVRDRPRSPGGRDLDDSWSPLLD